MPPYHRPRAGTKRGRSLRGPGRASRRQPAAGRPCPPQTCQAVSPGPSPRRGRLGTDAPGQRCLARAGLAAPALRIRPTASRGGHPTLRPLGRDTTCAACPTNAVERCMGKLACQRRGDARRAADQAPAGRDPDPADPATSSPGSSGSHLPRFGVGSAPRRGGVRGHPGRGSGRRPAGLIRTRRHPARGTTTYRSARAVAIRIRPASTASMPRFGANGSRAP